MSEDYGPSPGNLWNHNPARHLLVQNQEQKHQNHLRNLFKGNHKDTAMMSVTPVVCLLLTMNRFYSLLWCFHYWLLAIKCRRRIFCITKFPDYIIRCVISSFRYQALIRFFEEQKTNSKIFKKVRIPILRHSGSFYDIFQVFQNLSKKACEFCEIFQSSCSVSLPQHFTLFF